MIRNLLIVAGAGVVLAILGFAGAAGVGGADMARNGWNWTLVGSDGERVSFHRDGANSWRMDVNEEGQTDETITRNLDWTGGDLLAVDLPADVVHMQGAEAGVLIEGSRNLVDRVTLTDGRLSLAQGPSQRGRLRVTVTAPAVSRFEVNGSGDLSIRGYDQPSISASVNGAGDIEADGRAQTAEVAISGSGDVDLSPMTLEQARASINGSGEARLGPTQSAELTVSGSGDIVLTREPARTTTDVSGSGRVRRD